MVALGGMHGCSQGGREGHAWLLWGHVWLLPGGGGHVWLLWGHVWLLRGGMHGCSGGHVWLLPVGHVWLLLGACMVAQGHMWLLQGACVVAPRVEGGVCGYSRGLCMVA